MTVYVLPLPQTDGQAFTKTFVLSGATYRFDFYFNERTDTWSISLADGGGVDIATGKACILNYDLFAFVSDNRLPPGLLMLTDVGGNFTPAGRDELGSRVILLYDDLIDAS